MSPKLTLFPIDRFKGFQPTGGTRTAVLMDLRPNQMIAPFLKAKRALFFSKILYKYYGAELVVSENHRSGALFHFKEDRQSKRGCCLTEEWMHEARTSKGGARSMKKSSSGWKKGAAISTTKSPPQKSSIRRYHVTFKPKRSRKPRQREIKEQKPVCRKFSRCEGCPYPAHGFQCWGEDGRCLRTMLERSNSQKP